MKALVVLFLIPCAGISRSPKQGQEGTSEHPPPKAIADASPPPYPLVKLFRSVSMTVVLYLPPSPPFLTVLATWHVVEVKFERGSGHGIHSFIYERQTATCSASFRMESWNLDHPMFSLRADLESLFGASRRRAQLLISYTLDPRMVLLCQGRSSSLTEQAAPGGMHMRQ